jgi:hypothetical protein
MTGSGGTFACLCREFGHPISRPEFLLLFRTFELCLENHGQSSILSVGLTLGSWTYLKINLVNLFEPFLQGRLLQSLHKRPECNAREHCAFFWVHL